MQTWNVFKEKWSEKIFFQKSIKTAQIFNSDQFFYFLSFFAHILNGPTNQTQMDKQTDWPTDGLRGQMDGQTNEMPPSCRDARMYKKTIFCIFFMFRWLLLQTDWSLKEHDMPYADLEQTFLSETHLKLNTWTRERRTYCGHLLSFHL